MSKREPLLMSVIKEHEHYRLDNISQEWVMVEVYDHTSGFKIVSMMAPEGVLEFLPPPPGKVDCRWWWGDQFRQQRPEGQNLQ